MWYDEVNDFDFNNPKFNHGTGHFTQMVWKKSSQLGCGLVIADSNRLYGVCNYYPPGNTLNKFAQNVLPMA